MSSENHKNIPVDLNKAPVNAPAAMLPIVSCFPLKASMEELIPLYSRAILKDGFNGMDPQPDNNTNLPITPAELPMKVPLLVTEFKILLIRKLVFETERGFPAPSRTPHKPPRAKPVESEVNM